MNVCNLLESLDGKIKQWWKDWRWALEFFVNSTFRLVSITGKHSAAKMSIYRKSEAREMWYLLWNSVCVLVRIIYVLLSSDSKRTKIYMLSSSLYQFIEIKICAAERYLTRENLANMVTYDAIYASKIYSMFRSDSGLITLYPEIGVNFHRT